jgi:crossover junction endodeoxyribonuclease RuvC
MIVLGIDPGLANTGFGVVRREGSKFRAIAHGTLVTKPGTALELRLAHIQAHAAALLDEHEPDAIALESLYFGKNTSSALAVGQARGAVLAACGARSLACHHYTPQHIKQAVCGQGRAEKQQVIRMVGALLAVKPATDHAADALAVALCHIQRAPLAAAMGAAR